MVRSLKSPLMIAVCLLSLAGCGEKSTGEKGGASVASAAGPSAAWNAADACSILDKAAVADALKREVTEAQLSLVHEADQTTAATSECAYLGADGAAVARLMARWSPINDNTPEAIAMAKTSASAAMKAFSSKPLEDIPGLGKAAFLAPPISQLNAFIDDARMIVVTAEKVPDGASGKDIVIALAKKAGA